MKFDVTIKNSFVHPNSFDFPALTFRPVYIFKRSTLTRMYGHEGMLGDYYAKTVKERETLMKEVSITSCFVIFLSVTFYGGEVENDL